MLCQKREAYCCFLTQLIPLHWLNRRPPSKRPLGGGPARRLFPPSPRRRWSESNVDALGPPSITNACVSWCVMHYRYGASGWAGMGVCSQRAPVGALSKPQAENHNMTCCLGCLCTNKGRLIVFRGSWPNYVNFFCFFESSTAGSDTVWLTPFMLRPGEPRYLRQPQFHTSWDCWFPPLSFGLYIDLLLWYQMSLYCTCVTMSPQMSNIADC